MQLTTGTQVGPYRVDALIARGGMGAVYRATRHDGALVALKVLSGQGRRPEQVTRFEREAELTARLSHPGIVRVHGAGSAPGLHYIAMDLIDGEPLSARCGRVAPLEAARLVAQVARAIEHAHERGVLHRDVKPANVLVRREDGQALITDFGIARALEDGSSLTRTGALLGTPLYMSPEQATGQAATTATDVHGLGILLYEALTGRPPFEQPDLAAVLIALTRSTAAPPSALRPETPRALDRLCLAALRKDPARRPSAGAFAAGLEDLVAGRPSRTRRGRAVALLVGAAAVSLLAAAAGRARRAQAPPAPERPEAVLEPHEEPLPPDTTTSADPPWLRSLVARGDLEALRAAEDALRGDALLAVAPPSRTRALEALEALDAGWRDPRPPGVLVLEDDARGHMREGFERLVFIHALWRRLDPRHHLPPARLQLVGEMIFQGAIVRDRAVQVVRAVVELSPDDVQTHVLYAQTGEPRDLEEGTLRRGLVLADAAADHDAWQQIATSLADQLRDRALEGGPESAARSAFDALLQEVLARVDRAPQLASRLLEHDSELALAERRFDRALEDLDRALSLSSRPWELHQARLGVRLAAVRATGDEPHRVGAFADLDALLQLGRDEPRAQKSLALGAILFVTFLTREGWSEPALGVLDRALQVLDPAKGAECALVRVTLVARHSTFGEDRLAPALLDLVRRADARRVDLETRFELEPTVQQALVALVGVAREACSRLAARGAIDREELARTLEEHPGRHYLPVTYR